MSMAQRLPDAPHDAPHHAQHDAHDEFASIEAAVAGTARGRWFLDEYVRRAQNRDNERIIATLTRIERMLTADAQAKQTQPRSPEIRQPEATRLDVASFSPPIFAPPASSSEAPAAPARQGAALPVLSALRASGALDAPTPAPRPAPMSAPAAKAAVQSPVRSLAETLEQALLATQPLADAAGFRPEGRKLDVRKSEPPKPSLAVKPLDAPSPAPNVARPGVMARVAPAPSPYVPPAPPLAPPPAPPLAPPPALAQRAPSPPMPRAQRESSGPIPFDAKAFAQIEAMDAAMRGKLFA